jgi:hypothetical protein
MSLAPLLGIKGIEECKGGMVEPNSKPGDGKRLLQDQASSTLKKRRRLFFSA